MRRSVLISFIGFAFITLTPAAAQLPAYPDTADWKVWKLNVNSTFNDFSPLLYKKGIIFCSDRENDFGIVHYDRSTKKQLLDVYYSELSDSFKLSTPEGISRQVNTPFHDGPACFTPDGNSIYFTSSGRTKQKKNLMIFFCELKNGEWTEAQPLSLNKPSYSIAHPAFSPDGQTLYFVSDMPGGVGGTDLYQSRKTSDGWGPPQNMGAEINTSGNERFPFMDKNGILYFASDGWEGVGKLDIFSARKRGNNYEVLNMGYPFNTPADDFGYTCDSLSTKGFFSSNRGGKDDNVYGYYRMHPRFNNCETVKKNNYCFTFYEENAMMDKDTAGMVYQWNFGDSTTARGIQTDHCFRRAGDYFVQLNIIDSRTGMLFFNQSSYDFSVRDIQQLYIDVPDSVPSNKPVRFDASHSSLPGFDVLKYYWLFPGADYRTGNLAQLSFPQTGMVTANLAVIARNKKTGSMQEFCATKTIRIVKEEELLAMVKRNRPYTPSRDNYKVDTVLNITPTHDSITYKVHLGSSRKKIPADSKLFEGLADVKEIKDGEIYRYTSGETKKLFGSLPFYRAAQEKGFKEATVVAFENDRLISHQDGGLKGVIEVAGSPYDPAEAGKALDTSRASAYTILFKVNQFTLGERTGALLDSISAEIKEDKKLKIDILAHTDNRGNADYNLDLSRKRALSIRTGLINRGVPAARIRVIALGATKPLTENETETGRQSNRRADIFIHR